MIRCLHIGMKDTGWYMDVDDRIYIGGLMDTQAYLG